MTVTDVISMLKEHAKKHPKGVQRVSDTYITARHCSKLMNACCVNNDVLQAIELANVLFDCGYIKPGTYNVLEKLVEGYLNK